MALNARSALDRIANRRRTRLSGEVIRATWLHSLLRKELERKLTGSRWAEKRSGAAVIAVPGYTVNGAAAMRFALFVFGGMNENTWTEKNGAASEQAINNSSGKGNGRGLAGARGATGPRTLTGKKWSSRNSIKHGIFSSSLLLGEENANLYRSLLMELMESLDPQNTLESLLVEKLATITWSYRRLLLAENAAIHRNIDDLTEERAQREDAVFDSRVALEEFLARTDREGLLAKIAEPGVLEDCLEKLYQLRGQIEKHGPEGTDCTALGRVYRARYKGRPGKDLFDVYCDCANASHCSAEELQKKGFASSEDCIKKFLVELDKELQRLESLPKKPKPPDLEMLACKVPNAPELDRLLRYEASLERAFDRTLSQLERLQRMRLGQPVLPKLEVRHSLS